MIIYLKKTKTNINNGEGRKKKEIEKIIMDMEY
jgi:hypothetical protein